MSTDPLPKHFTEYKDRPFYSIFPFLPIADLEYPDLYETNGIEDESSRVSSITSAISSSNSRAIQDSRQASNQFNLKSEFGMKPVHAFHQFLYKEYAPFSPDELDDLESVAKHRVDREPQFWSVISRINEIRRGF